MGVTDYELSWRRVQNEHPSFIQPRPSNQDPAEISRNLQCLSIAE